MHISEKWKWSLCHVWHLATPWTAAHQAPPFIGFSRQEYWSGVPLPSPILRIILVYYIYCVSGLLYLKIFSFWIITFIHFLVLIHLYTSNVTFITYVENRHSHYAQRYLYTFLEWRYYICFSWPRNNLFVSCMMLIMNSHQTFHIQEFSVNIGLQWKSLCSADSFILL